MTAQTLILPDHEGAELKRWAIAAALVLFMHSALMASYFWFAPEEPEGSPDSTAILVDLAPVAVAPSSQSDDAAPGLEAMESPYAPKPPPQAKEEITEPIEKAEVPSDVTLPVPEPKAEEQNKTEDPDKKKVKTEVENQQYQEYSPKTTAAPRSNQQAAVAPRAPQLGADTASRDATKRYQHLVGARLQREKRYPASAEARRETGTVMLRFQLNPDGSVVSRDIVRSSGVPALDQEVLAMLERAQPLPAFLRGMTQQKMTLTVPVEFAR
ncbi:MAG: energy transducer TonB [Xanthobacteraceae bacterium]|nr:energy transducer TonB [Xanthobacteraceae bacterium]